MNKVRWICGCLLFLFSIQAATAGEGRRFWQVQNRLRLEYDDNIRQQEINADSSFKIIEDFEVNANANLQNTFLSLSYTPSFVWYENRPEKDTELYHYLNLRVNHRFSPRWAVSLKETFLRAEYPELVDSTATLREDNDYNHNDLNGDILFSVSRKTRLSASGRYLLVMYDTPAVAAQEDYDLVVGGITLGRQFTENTVLRGDLRAESVNYDQAIERDSDTVSLGVGGDQTFNPGLLASGRAGWSVKEFDSAQVQDTSAPYFDASMTLLPSPATRITAGAGYSLFEASVYPYVNQERLRGYISLANDFTARISLYLGATYTQGDYKAEEAPVGAGTVDGDEKVLLLSARATYQLNRSNWLELVWQYTDFTTSLPDRDDYTRNRVSVGWKTAL